MPRQIDYAATMAATGEFTAQHLKGERGAVFGWWQIAHQQPAPELFGARVLEAVRAAGHQLAESYGDIGFAGALRCAGAPPTTPVRTARQTQTKSNLRSSNGLMVAM